MARLLIPAAALALLAGCGGDDDPSSLAVALPGAPPEVRDRAPSPFCGQEDVQLDGAGVDEGARNCFLDAWRANERAEFISTFRTVEGDPVTEVFRAVAAGRIQVFIDSTQARLGGRRGWLVRVPRVRARPAQRRALRPANAAVAPVRGSGPRGAAAKLGPWRPRPRPSRARADRERTRGTATRST